MKKERIIIAAIKSWNIENALLFKRRYQYKYEIKIISRKEALNENFLKRVNPRYIFFPHWSWIIPANVHRHYECVVFHMTDLPFGRGGSPLQNLILRGKKDTFISALKVEDNLDAGPVYLKVRLYLSGSAESIYKRASNLIYKKMIPVILKNRPLPVLQKGRATVFSRRKPEESRVPERANVKMFYDYIRMLDAEGYPPAFLETAKVRIEFRKAIFKGNRLTASAAIIRKEETL